ncbi:cbb3-type cytochrome oxidase subunit 3 [Vreelandella subglaciescola]|jgi:cytochrome c oxidase cbb3-type subunit 4|uniref:Cytochrome c oxidase cbb3-type subunit 4 n=1 Tax=Vreelandella subglaciescola TaxID=29571 RepID=A0A1M7HY75_9GAMM|nr:cbb3-type cytochrome c oxidase subunit 3 [Halomonas subglaciescola]SHM33358.1 cytochrome c oxidase cbb3-type subunit 4 [Halomonas subglaciescola]
MTSGDFQGVVTLVLLIAFIGIIWWAYSKRRKPGFDEAANLPFADEDDEQPGHDKPAASQDTAESRQDKGDKNT